MENECREFTFDSGKGKVKARVNWNDSDEVKNSKLIEFSVGEAKFYVLKDDLIAFLMVIGSPQDIKDLLPMKLSKIKKYETILEFEWKASRDIRKGEKVTVRAPHIVEIPIEQEVLSGALPTKYAHTKDGIIKPKDKTFLTVK